MLLLYFLGHLTPSVGLIIVGLASLLYGLLGLILVFRWGAGRRVAIIEIIFFSVVGVLMLYAQLGGADELQTVITIISWLALLAGAALIALAFYRRSRADDVETSGATADGSAVPQQQQSVSGATEATEGAIGD